ncbi:MAG: hypothetical protein CXX67_06055 [Thaumarchaeota archaeon]|jgi:hypothetical protein|nr:MAG: hypothetical protein CXX67_06055 [Nitrososphaerota archaeon]
MDYDKLCESAKKADSKVRFAGIINSRGRLIAGGMVPSKKALEDEKNDEMLFMELALRVKMRSEFDSELGKVKFSLSLREKLIVMSFPIKNDVLLVSMERKTQFEKIASNILKSVEKL